MHVPPCVTHGCNGIICCQQPDTTAPHSNDAVSGAHPTRKPCRMQQHPVLLVTQQKIKRHRQQFDLWGASEVCPRPQPGAGHRHCPRWEGSRAPSKHGTQQAAQGWALPRAAGQGEAHCRLARTRGAPRHTPSGAGKRRLPGAWHTGDVGTVPAHSNALLHLGRKVLSRAKTLGTTRSEEWNAPKQGRGLTPPRDKAKPSLATEPTGRWQVPVSPRSPARPRTQHGAARSRDSIGWREDVSAHSHS